MAVSSILGQQPVAPTATAQPTPAPAPTPSAGKPADASKNANKDAFLAQGAALRQTIDTSNEGSKSGSISFVKSLGNPARMMKRKTGKGTSKENYDKAYEVVGFTFKAMEDIKVPVLNLKEPFTSLMDTEPATYIDIKAGTTFNLNLAETALLFSQPEFAGRVTGSEGKEIIMSFTFPADRQEPLPQFRVVGGGSIKENQVLIAEKIANPNGTVSYKLNPAYATNPKQFAPIFNKRNSAKPSKGAGSKATGETQKDIAAAMRLFFKNKGITQ